MKEHEVAKLPTAKGFIMQKFFSSQEEVLLQLSQEEESNVSSTSNQLQQQESEPVRTISSMEKVEFHNCSICFEMIEAEGMIENCERYCAARFHPICMDKWIETQSREGMVPTCPVCRSPI